MARAVAERAIGSLDRARSMIGLSCGGSAVSRGRLCRCCAANCAVVLPGNGSVSVNSSW